MTYPFPPGNAIWQPVDIVALLCQPGYMSPDDWRPVTGCAVVLAESGGNPMSTPGIIWKPGHDDHLSLDIGMFRLNTWWNRDDIGISGSLDPLNAMNAVWNIINEGRIWWAYNWGDWHGFTSGAYVKHLPAARDGLDRYRATLGLGALAR